MHIIPITLKTAKSFIATHHRHNHPPTGWKFGIGVQADSALVGVATAGRPIARHFDNGLTLEINRTCTESFNMEFVSKYFSSLVNIPLIVLIPTFCSLQKRSRKS